MYKLTARQITEITKGKLVLGDPDTLISGYEINSGKAGKGDLFLPLKGANTDGHLYIKQAVMNGAAGYLFSHGEPSTGAFAVKVDDVLTSLHRLAISRREKFKGKVIAITGSTGKTTTKDFIASILKSKYKLASSPKNFNTEIGLPLTMLGFEDDVQVLVVEMGMRGRGQIKLLADIAGPDIGVITNIGKTHIELLNSEENIAQAKSELIEALCNENLAFLNSEDKWTPYLSEKAKCEVKTYGLQSDNVSAEDIVLDNKARPGFDLSVSGLSKRVQLKIPGKHNVVNALAAAAVSIELGLTLDDIASGLEQAIVSEQRMEIKKIKDVIVLCDYYNASPQSVEAAIETLGQMKHGLRKVAILGDMLELGSISAEEHTKIVKKALEAVDVVYLVGKNMEEAAENIGYHKVFHSSQELAKEINQHILPGDVILLKASRAMAFENLEAELMGENASA